MRIAISNIAWEVAEDDAVATLLQQVGVNAIDVAPGKYFPVPQQASDADIARVKATWAQRGIEITGMQALLFGTTGLNLFGSPAVQAQMLQHLAAVCRIAAGLGAQRLVFGSPKNRDRSGLSDVQALDLAVPFFRQLGDIAQASGVWVCLEPNPPCYGANFMTHSAETAAVVRQVAHPNIRIQFDTGALHLNGESVTTVLADCADLIGHVHASEPNLVTLGEGGVVHAEIAATLLQRLPQQVVSIEMLPPQTGSRLAAVERALQVAVCHYRHGGLGV